MLASASPQVVANSPALLLVKLPKFDNQQSAITPYEKKSKRYKEITSAITYCIAKDMMPISTVEKQGFKKLMSVIDAKYALPGRKYYSKKSLPQLYAECRGKLEEQLRNVTHFTTTTDMWSSRTSEPYMSLTIHYVDKEWNLQSRCLQTAYSLDDHTAEIIAQGLVEALASWGLSEDRQVCITTDSGANIVKAVSLNNWTRLQCFGHRLHRAIERSGRDKRIERAVGICKRVVSAFSFSWKKRDLAAAKRGAQTHKMVIESPTRWGSRQKMVERVLEQEKAIAQVLSADKKTSIWFPRGRILLFLSHSTRH
ncbi:zinc finger BED domain-containing protein 1-like [Anguilla anguilla]|uniref:zinc finger BED domain-containing protein 1-like n=1 Tax=Anguilla anguilla TaxID=7936 RepID=UPI0015AEB50E|nr:zinc finger BED domain-containing protein 1-like [Anguilla anguilla]